MLETLPNTTLPENQQKPPTKHHELMKRLENAGYMKSDLTFEVLSILHTTIFAILTVLLCENHPFFAALSLAVVQTAGGWIGHSIDH